MFKDVFTYLIKYNLFLDDTEMAHMQTFPSLQISLVNPAQTHRVMCQKPHLGDLGSPHSRRLCHLYVPRGLLVNVTLGSYSPTPVL